MGTRSIIVVTDETKTKRIYKHYDGYPTENLEIIFNAVETNKTLDKIVEHLTTENKIQVEEEFSFNFNKDPKKCLGRQGDLEWMYVIDVPNKIVNVYKGNPNSFKEGTTNPLKYVQQLKGEYQREESKIIEKYMKAIEKIGYLINPPANSVVFIKRNLKEVE